MLVNLTVYFDVEIPVSILTTDQAVLESIRQTRVLDFFMVAGVRGDCLIIPQHKILSMVYIPAPVEKEYELKKSMSQPQQDQNEDTKREGKGEKFIEPSEDQTTRTLQ